MGVLVGLIAALLIRSTHGSQDSGDIQDSIGWVSEPNGRGTFSILSSCVLTLTLCVYTAVHLNIPGINESRAVRIWRTAKWVLLGIFAPELVVWIAWRQWASARGLARLVNQQQSHSHSPFQPFSTIRLDSRLQQQSPPLEISKIPGGMKRSLTLYNVEKWTTIHGFYAGMGGLVFDLPYTMDSDDNVSKDHFTRLTLTSRGLAFLAKCGLLPEITVEEIVDKSKADSLSKFLSCLQALWMLVQVLGRVATNLPVTLIEVNTIAHVVCALITYLLWWHKPKHVSAPTRLQGDWVRPVCTYMYMVSKISGWRKHRPGLLSKSWDEPEMSLLVFVPNKPINLEVKLETTEEGITSISENLSSTLPQKSLTDTDFAPVKFRPLNFPRYKRSRTVTGNLRPRPEVCPANDDDTIKHHATQLSRLQSSSVSHSSRWALAAEAIATYPPILENFVEPKDSDSSGRSEYLEPVMQELLVPYSSNYSSEGLIREFSETIVGTVLWFSTAVFGAIHIAAWNTEFPTELEMWLWRSSGTFIAFSGMLWLVINGLASVSKRFDDLWERILAMKAHNWIYAGIGFLSSICGACFVFSRAFLVAEAIVSLRKAPPAAYDTPDWTQIIPHL